MRKIVNILVIAIVAAAGAGYFTLGPSFFLGGPRLSDIVAVTRAAMVASAPSPAEVELAKKAEISPKGLCSHNADGSYACIVETSVNGSAAKTFVSVMKKTPGGDWVATE